MAPLTNMTMYEICAQTDRGQVRQNNEDAFAFDTRTGLCLLADGMGGYNAGEVASHMAVNFINLEMGQWVTQSPQATSSEIRRMLEICVDNANYSIFSAACAIPDYEGMGTTLVAGVFQDDRLVLGHIGDSRCYRLRGNSYVQITKDHSLLQEQIDAGLMTVKQALKSPHKNLITRALGVEGAVQVEVNEFKVEPGDLYLMCSDGLSDLVMDEAVAAILRRSATPPEKAALLVAAANKAGGRDNISVLLVQALHA